MATRDRAGPCSRSPPERSTAQADGSVEDHAGAAARELEEETGSLAGTWRYLGAFCTAPGFTNELMHLYLATDLRAADAGGLGPDEDERLELQPIPFAEAVAMAERGELRDAKSLIGLFWVDRLRSAGRRASGRGSTG